ncbi:MAG: membrane-bound PQQ-dependent dehydrogenase, glucose/quinate/shikimate family [Pseudomonadota bacterium]
MTGTKRTTARLLAGFFLLVALALTVGGAWLVGLGGSLYYLLAGLFVGAVAVLLWRLRPLAAWVYGAFLAATLIWALVEVGLDGWQLMPRLFGPAVLGLVFLLPGLRRPLGRAAFAPVLAGAAGLLAIGLAAIQPGPDAVADRAWPSRLIPDGLNPGEWPQYGRTSAGQRFSPLTQIDKGNVSQLKVAWTYRTGVVQEDTPSPLVTTPVMVGNRLVLCTQTNIVIALDPETGRELWRFDPKVNPEGASAVRTCRGVAYHADPALKDCPERVVTGTFGAQLIALDIRTGRPCAGFGKGGFVDLKEGMGEILPGYYFISSAPVIVRGNIIVGGGMSDNQGTDEPSGVIRAFDVATGKMAWAWDAVNPANRNGPPPGQWYSRGSPNSWAPMSADEALGLVYVPTGNPTPDFFGGQRRPGDDKYGSAVVALDAATGDVRWSFQTVHHDLWDYDVASQPTLLDVEIGGKAVPALAQATKRGEIFLLDRRTGTPLTAVEERTAPRRGAVPEERIAPTQPFPVGMPSFAGAPLVEKNMWGLTPLDQLWCRVRFRQLRYDGPMTPPGTDEALIYPSIGGGMNYGGVSYDPERQIMLVNSFYYGTIAQLVPRAETDRLLRNAKSQAHSATNFDVPQAMLGTPYGVRQSGLISPFNVLCNAPPFGKLSAIDMRTRKLLWSRPIGTAQDSGPFGLSVGLPIPMGMPGWGGMVTTRSGITFTGYVKEKAFRAFDTVTGKELWKARIPASANGNPMTYTSPASGRQFVVAAAGGHVMLQSLPLSDTIVAFALPKTR